MGLKETAPLAGFAWRFDDAGGSLAMVKYDQATDEDVDAVARERARQWILDYNEDDVRATAALRELARRAGGGVCRRSSTRRTETRLRQTRFRR